MHGLSYLRFWTIFVDLKKKCLKIPLLQTTLTGLDKWWILGHWLPSGRSYGEKKTAIQKHSLNLWWHQQKFKVKDYWKYILGFCWPWTLTVSNFKSLKYPSRQMHVQKVNNRNTRTRCEICSMLTIKTSERRNWHRSGVFTVNSGHISHLVLILLLLTLSR